MVEQTYRVDMIPNGIPLVVHVSQYDTEARRLIFELYKGDVAYEVPAGAAASIAGTKPDKTAFIYPMAIDGNVVSIDLKQQMAIVAGDVLTEIQITDSTGKIGSANFVIRVERGPIDEDSVISETDLPIFEELVSDAQAAAADAQTAANTASAAASSVASIVPASPGTAGQLLTRTANGADWQTLDLSGKANTSTLATVERSSTASKTYAVGDYLVYNGILYKVISEIQSGHTLTPGTNISATNAGAELTSLNNGLTTLTDKVVVSNGIFTYRALNLNANQSQSFEIAGGTRFVLFSSGANSVVHGILIGNTGSTNSFTGTKLSSNSSYGVNVNAENGTLTISNNTANYAAIGIIVISGRIQ